MNESYETIAPSHAAAAPRDAVPAPIDALVPEQTVCGFSIERTEEIPELDAQAYVMRHTASGARLLYLACNDENKAFAIGFKTPPADDTGVFHILEHSVLCGSAKFPVKEPFVDLIKSSMQTFLNAMTYPDKTVYPVASTNEQDLLNLMDVYMDAVLNPAIYTKPTIFQQEGWHLELDVPEGASQEASLGDCALRYNGVVYNEMKGALSDPMSVLDDAMNRALFPSTAYAFESGGDPAVIPSLTYEQFLDAHARHYQLSNSYIVLYGDFADVRRELAFLDEHYLSDAAREQSARAKAEALGQHAPSTVGAPNPLGRQNAVVCEYERVDMATTPENALVGVAYVLGDALDTRRVVAADVLFEALLGTNEAPIKKAIIAAGLGGNVSSYTSSSCLQPYEMIILQGAKPHVARDLSNLIVRECQRLVDEGVPRDRLEAVISNNEYSLRQRDYGTADGVVLACEALSTWLYAEDGSAAAPDAATRAIKYADTFAWLREQLSSDFFESLLRELVLESDHHALVELVPALQPSAPESTDEPLDEPVGEPKPAQDTEAERLAKLKASMTERDLDAIAANVDALRAAQEAEDSLEAKATLPRLKVSDIGAGRPEPPLVIETVGTEGGSLPCLRHDIPTHGIAYALTYFDLTHLSFAELPYVKVLCRLMQQLATKQHGAAELDSLISSNLGFLSFTPEVFQQGDWRLARPMLCVAAGSLSEKIDSLADIPREVWSETRFDDTQRIRDVLAQLKIGMEQVFINAGHQAALARSISYSSPAGVVHEQLGGVDFYRFLCDLLDHFDERVDDLCDKLRELQARIFTSTGTVASFTGSAADYERYWAHAGNLGLSPRTAPAKELYVPMPEPKHEAFVIPSDVSYLAQACDPRRLGIETGGTWSVAANALSYDYLWNEIRVKGGAYGCGFRAVSERQLAFYTYRDPAIDPSRGRIAQAGSWLSAFEPEPAAFEGFIVATVSGIDAPVKPYALTKRRNGAYFSKREPGYREKLRAEMLAATPEALRELGDAVTRVGAEAPACVFGGRNIIEASNEDWNVIELMG